MIDGIKVPVTSAELVVAFKKQAELARKEAARVREAQNDGGSTFIQGELATKLSNAKDYMGLYKMLAGRVPKDETFMLTFSEFKSMVWPSMKPKEDDEAER